MHTEEIQAIKVGLRGVWNFPVVFFLLRFLIASRPPVGDILRKLRIRLPRDPPRGALPTKAGRCVVHRSRAVRHRVRPVAFRRLQLRSVAQGVFPQFPSALFA